MSKLTRIILAAQVFGLALLGCEDSPVVPPKDGPAGKPAEMDLKHVAQILADRQITVPNLAFVLQFGSRADRFVAVSLTSTRPGPDGVRLIFGTFESASSVRQLASSRIDITGRPTLNLRGSGIFTKTAAYQPKFATLSITEFDEEEIHGTITGEFYRFRLAAPTAPPIVLHAEGTFSAILVIR